LVCPAGEAIKGELQGEFTFMYLPVSGFCSVLADQSRRNVYFLNILCAVLSTKKKVLKEKKAHKVFYIDL